MTPFSMKDHPRCSKAQGLDRDQRTFALPSSDQVPSLLA
jgi:hypothetical protein